MQQNFTQRKYQGEYTEEQKKRLTLLLVDAQAFVQIQLGLAPDRHIALDYVNLCKLLANFGLFSNAVDEEQSSQETAPPVTSPAARQNLEDLRAKALYDAYCERTGYRSAVTGDPLPTFEKLPEAVRDAWGAAAHATFVHPAFGRC